MALERKSETRTHKTEMSYEARVCRRLQLVYTRQLKERRIFMQDLFALREHKEKKQIRILIKSVGPAWYQVLSVKQRQALDTLEFSIYKDLIEQRPTNSCRVIKTLGILPMPSNGLLMLCVHMGKNDPKEMLAQLYLHTYDSSIEQREHSYCLTAKLLLSGILYLGLNNLIELLREKFRAPETPKEEKPKKKRKPEPKPESPYLQKMPAAWYRPPERKPKKPLPLPNLDDLDEPFEIEPMKPKPVPPPKPPPPKKVLPISYCEKLAGIYRITAPSVESIHSIHPVKASRSKKIRSKMRASVINKPTSPEIRFTKNKRKKIPAPKTGSANLEYHISGIFTLHGRTAYVLSNVVSLPPEGDLIHGGMAQLNGPYVNIHCGYTGRRPPNPPQPCDCVKKWHTQVFDHLKSTKCTCGHHYDFRNEGPFEATTPYFEKPKRNQPFSLNYDRIFDVNEKRTFIEDSFKKITETDSLIRMKDGQVKKKVHKKKIKRSSKTCLGDQPTPEDYLRCGLRPLRRQNIAARLPMVHLVPELLEWMRRRIYGPISESTKIVHRRQDQVKFVAINGLLSKGLVHVSANYNKIFRNRTTWTHKHKLNEKFKVFRNEYMLKMYRNYANLVNLLWATMAQDRHPDKKFREIYFSYFFDTIQNMQLLRPYNKTEMDERRDRNRARRYVCLPDGIENLDL